MPTTGTIPNPTMLHTYFIVVFGTGSAFLVALAVALVGMGFTLHKAGQPGWGVIVPIYNIVLLLRTGHRSIWWTLLVVPTVGTAVESTGPALQTVNPYGYASLFVIGLACGCALSIVSGLGVASTFGRSVAFGVVALGLFPFVGYAILGFGRATPHRQQPSVLDRSW